MLSTLLGGDWMNFTHSRTDSSRGGTVMNKLRNHHLIATKLCSLLLCAVLSVSPAGALVGEMLITFETIPGITAMISFIDGSASVPTDARLSTQLQMSDGVSFSSAAGYVAVVRLGSGHATS